MNINIYWYWYQYEYWYHPTPPHAGAVRRRGPGGRHGVGWGSINIHIDININIDIHIIIKCQIVNMCVYNPLALPSRRRPQALFFWKATRLFYKWPHCCFFVLFFFCFYLFLKTPNRRGTQFHAEKWSNFVLSSHLDPIGDRNDVRELLLLFSMLGLCLLPSLSSSQIISPPNLSPPPPPGPTAAAAVPIGSNRESIHPGYYPPW